jgi:glucokinase
LEVFGVTDMILGIEIGGTKLQLALGTPDGSITTLHQGIVDVKSGGDGIRRWLSEHIPDFLKQEGVSISQVAVIGCGFGGPIDRNAGKTLVSNQISGWHNFALRDWLEDAFDLPAWVENDSNAAAWGEYRKGFGKGTQHFFYTNLGSGVGGGFIFNGELYDGLGFGAGEFGYTYVPDLAKTGACEPVKIEHICSGWSIENRLRQPGYIPETSQLNQLVKGDIAYVTTHDLATAAKNGDLFALSEIDLVAHTLGIGLANVLSLTNVERIAIGGGVSKLGDLLIEPVRRYTEKYVFVSSQGRYQIQQSKLGDAIVLIGAILLAKQNLGV